MCHTPSLMDIYRSTLEVIFNHQSSHILSLHLIGSIITWKLFFSTSGKIATKTFLFWPRVSTKIWSALTLVKLTLISTKIFIFEVRIFLAQKSRLDVDFDRAVLIFAAAVFALTGTTLTFVDFGLTDIELSERVVWHILVGWLYWDFVGWSILLTVVTHHNTYSLLIKLRVFLACLLSIYWYVLSTFNFLVYVIDVWYWE